MQLVDQSVDQRVQTVVDAIEDIKTKLDTIIANQGTQETEINLVKIELQGCNTKLDAIKTAVENTLNVNIV